MKVISGLFTVFCALLLPLGAAVYLCSRKKGFWKPVLTGAITFFVFQILIRLPIIQLVLPHMPWYLKMSINQPLLYALFIGATAGLAEEFGRYITMRLFLKNNVRVADGIAFGVGHGGIEAILLVGINTLIVLLVASRSISPGLMFAGGIERIATLMLHICWSVMVMKSMWEKKSVWLFVAFFTHTIIDGGVVYASVFGLSVRVIETVVFLCALCALAFIIKEYKTEGENK